MLTLMKKGEALLYRRKNVLFLKRSEYKTKRPVTKIYLERQKSEEGVGSPAEQGDAESWVVFCPEARAAC